jgi:hypothetical protein
VHLQCGWLELARLAMRARLPAQQRCDMTPPRCRQGSSAPQAQSGRVLLGKTVHMTWREARAGSAPPCNPRLSRACVPRAVTATLAHIVHTLRPAAPFFSPLTPWIARTYSAAAAADVPAATTPSGPAPSDVAREVAGDTMEVRAGTHTLHCIKLPENAPESYPLFRTDG